MNYSDKVKLLAQQMMDSMTEQEKQLLLFIHLCDMFEQDDELLLTDAEFLEDNEELMSRDDVTYGMEDIFPATYKRIKKDLK